MTQLLRLCRLKIVMIQQNHLYDVLCLFDNGTCIDTRLLLVQPTTFDHR